MTSSSRVASRQQAIDVERVTHATSALLSALGVDVEQEGLRETPARMARAYAELLTAPAFSLTTFPNDERYDELVIARGIPVQSLCEHHLLPFFGVAHVAYIPDERLVGLSKLARVVEWFARRLQVQERLTHQIANFLDDELHPKGVGVVISAEHTCMSFRGVHVHDTTVVTSALRGRVRTDQRTRAEFLDLARRS